MSRPHRTVRRRSWPVAAAVGLSAALAAGCVGQTSRNDDHVGPWSYRPDAREHTLGPPPPTPQHQEGGT